MTFSKTFLAVFLAIVAAVAVIGLTVGTYNSQKRREQLHRKINEMYVNPNPRRCTVNYSRLNPSINTSDLTKPK